MPGPITRLVVPIAFILTATTADAANRQRFSPPDPIRSGCGDESSRFVADPR